MKITIYELLGMIKDGKAPKKVKYSGVIFENNGCNCYLNERDKSLSYCVEIPMFLNDEVEIIEEEKKIPEKLSTWYSVEVTQSDEENVEYENYNFETIYEKINEIIDYLKSKGE